MKGRPRTVFTEKDRKDNQWKSQIKYQYGINVDEYNRMFDEQRGSCAICGAHQSQLSKRLYIDHDHQTGKVRGLLCRKCNLSISYLKDDVSLLTNAIHYLEKGRGSNC